MGGNAYLAIRYELEPGENRCRLIFTRCPPPEEADAFPSMDANSPVTLILRPDVDDCSTHSPTLAFQGAERAFPKRVAPLPNGFAFTLGSGNRLEARMSRGIFLKDGEWTYNLHNPLEEERGLRANRDLYSPGHFRLELKRGEAAVLEIAVLTPETPSLPTPKEPREKPPFHERNAQVPLLQALEEALEAFVVRRDSRKTVIAGYQKKNAILTDKEKWIVSYHEIGHALVAARQTHSAPVQKITIIPRTSGALGYTMQVEEGNHYLMSREEIENKIATFTGGRAAEEVVFGSVTTGASNDIEQATKLARAMLTRYGMSDEFGMVALETVTNQYLGGDASLACSPETQTKIDRLVVELVERQHQKALQILRDDRQKLDELARFLHEKETITGEEFMNILNA